MNNCRQPSARNHWSRATASCWTKKDLRERVAVTTSIFITPLDDDMKPLRNPIRGRTRDLLTTGVSFVHATPFDSKFVVLSIGMPGGEEVELLFRVVRSESNFEGCRFFTAGEFVKRLENDE